MKLKISNLASKDLQEIYLYGYINFGEEIADKYTNTMKMRIDIICNNPEIGRLDTRINPAIHRFETENHVIFYDICNKHILIIRILHKSTDFIKQL